MHNAASKHSTGVMTVRGQGTPRERGRRTSCSTAEHIPNIQLGAEREEPSIRSSGQLSAHLDFHIFVALLCMKIEVYNLRTQACLHLSVHLVTGFYQGFSQLHMISSQTIVSSQCQRTRQKANQVILQDTTALTGEKNTQQTGICVRASLCPCVSMCV